MKILFINSKNHWRNGWLTTPEELQIAMNVLQKAGIEVGEVEVENVAQLEKVLDNLPSGTLAWPNAYYVDAGAGTTVWLSEYIEERQLPYLGSNAKTLQTVLQKDVCQTLLQENGLPIPAFTVIDRENILEIESIIHASNIGFPMVLKPTAESGSVGVVLAKTGQEAIAYSHQLLADFPLSNVIMEEFLPSDDITCGFLQLGNQYMLLPTSYIVKSAAGKTNILSRKERLRAWDDEDKMQPPITDETILEQLSTHILPIVKTLDIRGITRIDGRLDKYGTLRFFDVNGLPALCFPDAVMVNQCFTCFSNYSQMEVFTALIHTIVHHSLLQYGWEVPTALKEHNLFTMESKSPIWGKINNDIMETKI